MAASRASAILVHRPAASLTATATAWRTRCRSCSAISRSTRQSSAAKDRSGIAIVTTAPDIPLDVLVGPVCMLAPADDPGWYGRDVPRPDKR